MAIQPARGMLLMTGVALSACSGGPALPGLPDISALPSLSNLSVGSITTESSRQPLPSAEVYSRIARGANACWFGPRGRIGTTHLLHADAAPSMNGGAVEMVVHERAVDQPKPWGYKAFRVLLTESAGIDGPGTGGTDIAVENTRIPDAEGARMRAEVFQWAAGTESCKADPALDKSPEPVAAAPALAAKAKAPRKTPAKASQAASQSAAK
jgi:hypothetical protein